jgi:hypothetical protein
LFEWLNKVLKSYKTNNHGNGELKTTFFREFQCTCELGRLTFSLFLHPPESVPSQVAHVMLKATNEERGTVAALATLSHELDHASADGTVTSFHRSPLATNKMSNYRWSLLCIKSAPSSSHHSSDTY